MTHILSYSTKKPMEGPLLAQVLFECNLKVHVQSFTETDGRTISFASFPNQTGAITPHGWFHFLSVFWDFMI